jgi:hypothetical protein
LAGIGTQTRRLYTLGSARWVALRPSEIGVPPVLRNDDWKSANSSADRICLSGFRSSPLADRLCLRAQKTENEDHDVEEDD